MRKRETNRWIQREYHGAGDRRRGEKETKSRKRVSLTNATRGHGRRVIITHLSPVGSAYLVESVGGALLGPVEDLVQPSVAFMVVPARLFLSRLSLIFTSFLYLCLMTVCKLLINRYIEGKK